MSNDATTLMLHTLFALDRPALTGKPPHGNGHQEGTTNAAAGAQWPLTLADDAGAMYDVLGMIVDFYEGGLIDELARELVERHS